MQVYKLKGKIDESGHVIIDETLNIAPGEVDIIILQPATSAEISTETATAPQGDTPKRPTKIKAFQDWFEKTQPASPDFDADQARWEALKEKYNL